MYVVGLNRLFYTPAGFTPGLAVTGKLMDQRLTIVQDGVSFVEYEPGMYYCDITIPEYGTYIMRTFEGGVLRLVQTIPVDPPWGLVRYKL